MSTFEFDVVPVDGDGSKAFNDDTKAWQAIETFLNARGALGWQTAAALGTRPHQLILEKAATSGLERVVTVAKSGGDFDTIQAAIDYVYTTYTLDGDNWAVIEVSPGNYTEQIHSYRYIIITGPPARRIDYSKTVTLQNIGDDPSNYPLRGSDENDRYYIINMNIKTTATGGGIIGPITRHTTFQNCHFDGKFIENTVTTSHVYVIFRDCYMTDDAGKAFDLTGVNLTSSRRIMFEGTRFNKVTPTFSSTHDSGTTSLFFHIGCRFGNSAPKVSGDWVLEAWDSLMAGGRESVEGRLEFGVTGVGSKCTIINCKMPSGMHFSANPETTVLQNNLFWIEDGYDNIPAGEGDITADVDITNVIAHGNRMHHGMDGEIQIASKIKNVGIGLPNTYRSFQEAMNSVWENGSHIMLGEDVVMGVAASLPSYSLTVDGRRTYGIHSDQAPHAIIPADKDITLARLTYFTGDEVVISGNNAHLMLTDCGALLESSKAVTVRFRVAAGNANTHLRFVRCNMMGSSVHHNCVKVDAADPIVFVDRTTMIGYTGHPAMHMTVQTIGKWRSKYSTFSHGDGALNEWATIDVSGTELRSYQDSFNAGSMVAPDTLTNASNQISKPGSTNDPEITY